MTAASSLGRLHASRHAASQGRQCTPLSAIHGR